MARGRRDGIVIAGGGVAGCLAALAMARLRPEVPLLIVEESERFGDDGFHAFADGEFDSEAMALVEPLIGQRWPGFYLAFPGLSRNLKSAQSGFAAGALHQAMTKTLDSRQYRLGARVVAVREDALVLDGGEEIKAEGAIDARGAANLSMLDLLYEARLERDYVLKAPHRLDRPVLIDATVDQDGGLRFVQCLPLAPERLLVADVCVSERAQPDEEAGRRLDAYLVARGWQKKRVTGSQAGSQPLPFDGDFAAFWRLGGARVAKLGLRGGFVHPLTGHTLADAAYAALILTRQHDFSGAALHDLFEEEAWQLWRRREVLRSATAALAAGAPDARRDLLKRLYSLEPGLIARLRAGRLGLLDRGRIQRALARP